MVLVGVLEGNGPSGKAAPSRGKVVLDHLAFEVTRVRSSERGPADTLMAVDVVYENVGVGPATAFTADSGFLGGDGKTYGLESGGTGVSNLPHGESRRARFVFRVAPPALRGGRLLLVDCAAPLLDVPSQRCAVATIDLGLR